MDDEKQVNKKHHASASGRGKKAKMQKKKLAKENGRNVSTGGQNVRAFTVANIGRLQKDTQRLVDRAHRKHVAPVHKIETEEINPPPVVVVVHGPKNCGKTMLIKSLVKRWTRQTITDVSGPITVITGKNRRITLFECPSDDINSMVDLSKVADLVLMMINAKQGFDLCTFEMLNLIQTHGMTKIIGVLSHLDEIRDLSKQKKIKKKIKARFWTETYDGAKLFYLSQLRNGKYLKNEVQNLGRFVSLAKFRPLIWRNSHSYMICDRLEDVTSPILIDENEKIDRKVVFFGYLRGIYLRADNAKIHIPGVGDFTVDSVQTLPDPCPLGDKESELVERKRLSQKDTLLYAPMANIGSVVYDKDAVYIDLPNVHFTPKDQLIKTIKKKRGTDMASDLDDDDQVIEEVEDDLDGVSLGEGVSMVKHLQGFQALGSSGKSSNSRLRLFRTNEDGESVSGSDISGSGTGSSSDADDQSNDSNASFVKKLTSGSHGPLSTAANAMSYRQNNRRDIMDIVYSVHNLDDPTTIADDTVDSDDENFFKPIGGSKSFTSSTKNILREEGINDELDTTQILVLGTGVDWVYRDVCSLFKARFVTGTKSYEGSELDEDDKPFEDIEIDGDGGMDISGDFDDIEEEPENQSKSETELEEDLVETEEPQRTINEIREQNAEGKARKKEVFDTSYDNISSNDILEEKNHADSKEVDLDDEYLKEQSQTIEKQKSLNKTEFKDVDPLIRQEYEGIRPGAYIRIEISNIPCELMKNFSPKRPLICGGLGNAETGLSFIKARIKKHRWFEKSVLKSNDPLVFSFGWRRFQVLPLYFTEDQNQRKRFLKYTPEHMHCLALFQGPGTPLNTPFACFQDIRENQAVFRIAASGISLEASPGSDVVKKLKLVGEPYKILKNTCFVKNMFNSDLEAAKFEGASLQTVSGIRGVIKKAVTNNSGAGATGNKSANGAGCFRATFEDKIKMSDLVFCRTWVKVEPKTFYNPICNLLEPDTKLNGTVFKPSLMKTVGQLRYEKRMNIPVNTDSIYKEIERAPVGFAPFTVPKALEKVLPFKVREKHDAVISSKDRSKKWEDNLDGSKKVVVYSAEEKKIRGLIDKLTTLREEKSKKNMEIREKRLADKKKKDQKLMDMFAARKKEEKKRKYRTQGLAAKRQKTS